MEPAPENTLRINSSLSPASDKSSPNWPQSPNPGRKYHDGNLPVPNNNNMKKFWNLPSTSKDSPHPESSTVRWDEYSGEPTGSDRGKPPSATPGSVKLHEAPPGKLAKSPEALPESRSMTGKRRVSSNSRPEDATKPPWKGASGRQPIVHPIVDSEKRQVYRKDGPKSLKEEEDAERRQRLHRDRLARAKRERERLQDDHGPKEVPGTATAPLVPTKSPTTKTVSSAAKHAARVGKGTTVIRSSGEEDAARAQSHGQGGTENQSNLVVTGGQVGSPEKSDEGNQSRAEENTGQVEGPEPEGCRAMESVTKEMVRPSVAPAKEAEEVKSSSPKPSVAEPEHTQVQEIAEPGNVPNSSSSYEAQALSTEHIPENVPPEPPRTDTITYYRANMPQPPALLETHPAFRPRENKQTVQYKPEEEPEATQLSDQVALDYSSSRGNSDHSRPVADHAPIPPSKDTPAPKVANSGYSEGRRAVSSGSQPDSAFKDLPSPPAEAMIYMDRVPNRLEDSSPSSGPNDSILNRKRPVAPAGTKLKRKPIGAEPVAIVVSNDAMEKETKDLPNLPMDAPAEDRVQTLQAKQDILRRRRRNLETVIGELTSVVQPSNIAYDQASRTEIKKTVVGLEKEMAEVVKEEHETGLKLHRAWKRQEKVASYEPTSIWVRRVTS